MPKKLQNPLTIPVNLDSLTMATEPPFDHLASEVSQIVIDNQIPGNKNIDISPSVL